MGQTINTPKWMQTILDKVTTGEEKTFIISGNIGDYAYQTITLVDYLKIVLPNMLNIDNIVLFTPEPHIEVLQGGYSKAYLELVKQEKMNAKPGARPWNLAFADICESISGNFQLFDGSTAYIFAYADTLIPESMNLTPQEKSSYITLHKNLTSKAYWGDVNNKNLCFFISESIKDINKSFLSSNIKSTVLEIGLPDYQDRLDFLDFYCKENGKNNEEYKKLLNTDSTETNANNMDIKAIARFTAGLSYLNIEDMLLNYSYTKTLTSQSILNKKKELISKGHGDIIEIYDTEGFNLSKFAGQENIKAYFKDVVIDAIAAGETSIVPKGVMLMGPPGTGKTYFSRCLAGDAGINFVEFKMSKILDKWVGESEKRLEKAFSVFRALAPVGVFIDEMDQALGRGGEDGNSVGKSIFGMFLAELSKPENRGKIIWIGATNYPNKIDEALKRSGRFDKKIPFFAPSKEERKAVFKIHLDKTGIAYDKDISLDELSTKTDGYTQAEIENIVVKALELSKRRRLETITKKCLDDAVDFMLTAQNGRIKEMEDIALCECNDLEFVPEKYRARQKALMSKS